MEQDFWQSFETSGKIEDYLKYKGIQHIDGKKEVGGLNEATEGTRSSNQGDTV